MSVNRYDVLTEAHGNMPKNHIKANSIAAAMGSLLGSENAGGVVDPGVR